MKVKDIYKLFYHDNIYVLDLMICYEWGECISKYRQEHFTENDWNKKVKWLDVRDETIDVDNPIIIIYCYVEED